MKQPKKFIYYSLQHIGRRLIIIGEWFQIKSMRTVKIPEDKAKRLVRVFYLDGLTRVLARA